MEASAVGYGFNTGFKYIIGRSRPGSIELLGEHVIPALRD
jgi:hypothetical protein